MSESRIPIDTNGFDSRLPQKHEKLSPAAAEIKNRCAVAHERKIDCQAVSDLCLGLL